MIFIETWSTMLKRIKVCPTIIILCDIGKRFVTTKRMRGDIFDNEEIEEIMYTLCLCLHLQDVYVSQ